MHDPEETQLEASHLRIDLAVSSYHSQITDSMATAAIRCFLDAGGQGTNIMRHTAPGTWELIGLCHALTNRPPIEQPDAIVAIGCVITGETTHDQYIASGVTQALATMTVQTGIPIALGILTCQSLEQAQARSGGSAGNKGEEAMAASIALAQTIRALKEPIA